MSSSVYDYPSPHMSDTIGVKWGHERTMATSRPSAVNWFICAAIALALGTYEKSVEGRSHGVSERTEPTIMWPCGILLSAMELTGKIETHLRSRHRGWEFPELQAA